MKILIVEDESDLLESICSYLGENEFVCDGSSRFDDAMEKIHLYDYDCVVVDIGLPDGSGMDIISHLKKTHNSTGVVVISAKNAPDDRIKGLQVGADDYISKPFHLGELNARIRSVIRRCSLNGEKEILFGELRILPDDYKVEVTGKSVELTKKEFALLLYMVINKDHVVTKESIAEHIWGSQADLVDSFEFIYSHVKNLRKKLITAGAQDYIQTVYGVGYRFGEK